MTTQQPTIIYTLTDEAPLLATYASCPSSAPSPRRRASRSTTQRHLGGRPHPGRVPRVPDRRRRRCPTTWPSSAG